MLGEPTLAELYLGSLPKDVTVEEDQLIVTLADGRSLELPLAFVSEISHRQPLPAEARLLVLQQPPRIDQVHVTDTSLNVYLQDGRLLSSPLVWFPRLLHGTPAERNHYELLGEEDAIHWPELDEDIDLLGLLKGGKSGESERSIQRWLQSRVAVPAL